MLKLSIKEQYTDDSKRNSIFNNLNSLFYSNNKIKNINEKENAEDDNVEMNIVNNIEDTNYILDIPNSENDLIINKNKPIELCIYQVCNKGKYPFLLFLLKKNSDNSLSFFNFISNFTNSKKVKYNLIKYINSFFPKANIEYSGFYETNEKNIVILNYENNYSSIITTNDNNYIWVSAYEIINTNKVYNFIINNYIIDFFYKNLNFLKLKNNKGTFYEHPIISYYQVNKILKEEDVDCIDIYRKKIVDVLEKSYYFYNSLPNFSNDKSILRVALFKGKLSFKNIELYKRDKSYDSLYYIHNNVNRYYIIRNYNQHSILSLL